MKDKKPKSQPKEGLPLLILGAGSMGSALIGGLLKSPLAEQVKLYVYDPHAERRAALMQGERVHVVETPEAMPAGSRVVVICTKPQDLHKVAGVLQTKLNGDELVISILAGTTIADVAAALAHKGAVVRAMPNICATVGLAATAMCCNEVCGEEKKDLATRIFQSVGEAYWTHEDLLDTVTGLSGSGPAYIYMVIEALTDGGVKMGLPRELSHKLSVQTVLGAATLVKVSGLHPAVLKDQVTTPAGTTISALHELEAHGLRHMFVSAVVAATERSKVLRKGKSSS